MTPLLYLEIDLYLSFSLNTFLSSKIFWNGIIFPTYLLYIFLKYENEKFEGHQLESINYVEDIIKNNGGLILENLDQIAEFLNNKC